MMSKRIFSLLLSIVLLCGLFGCSADETPEHIEPIEDIYPEMTYGVWETDLLKSEPGNYERSARVSNGQWAETAYGMYLVYNNQLYYADKPDLNNWVPLCRKPNCGHSDSFGCSAYVPYGVCFSGGRIYYLVDAAYKREFYTGNKKGYILCSMAMDGTDEKLEYIWEDTMLDQGGSLSAFICQTAFGIVKQQMNENGVWHNQLFFADSGGARCVYELDEESKHSYFVLHPKYYHNIAGETVFCTDYAHIESGNYMSSISWVEGDQLLSADLTGLPYWGGYFFDGNLRIFRANDGYYDVDLDTMEEVKLCDAQFENSGAKFIQANCILESNLFPQNTWNYYDVVDKTLAKLPRVGEGALRLFNGQQWLDVELPEELKNLPESTSLEAVTLTGEYVICTAKIDGVRRYYRIDLAAENLKLEYWFEMN